MNNFNFASFLKMMYELNPALKDTPYSICDLYRKFIQQLWGYGWNINSDPILGAESKYHFVYATLRSDGKIYIGKHSTYDIQDGYKGSGTEIHDTLNDKRYTFITVPLDFRPCSDEAFQREAVIVNKAYLSNKDFVLNKIEGGKDSYLKWIKNHKDFAGICV